MFIELMFNKRKRKFRSVNRDFEFSERIGHGTDMVFMSVCNKETAQLIRIRFNITHIGYDRIDPEHIFIGKCKPAVNNYHVTAVFNGSHIFSYFAKPSEGDDPELG